MHLVYIIIDSELTIPIALAISDCTVAGRLRLHPPRWWEGADGLRSKYKLVVLGSSATVVSTEAEPPPGAAGVVPLTAPVDCKTDIIRLRILATKWADRTW